MKTNNEEMVYTGITRAKQNLIVFVEEEVKYLDFLKNQTNFKSINKNSEKTIAI